jgi:membrane protein implicated in regulation of membrane protease activity
VRIEQLLAWWNLIYLLPLGLASIYLLCMAFTGVGLSDTDADADADADVDADTDADVHVDADADAEADADADADVSHDVDAVDHTAPDTTYDMLGFLGVGKLPISLLVLILLITWGMIGFIANAATWTLIASETLVPLVSIPAAALGSVLATSGIAALVSRWMPLNENYVHRKAELVGRLAEAVLPIDENFGMVALKDERGDRFQLPCRVAPGQPAIAKGQQVVLFRYNRAESMYYAAVLDEAEAANEALNRDSPPTSTRSVAIEPPTPPQKEVG